MIIQYIWDRTSETWQDRIIGDKKIDRGSGLNKDLTLPIHTVTIPFFKTSSVFENFITGKA
jgi:hypothetical protein